MFNLKTALLTIFISMTFIHCKGKDTSQNSESAATVPKQTLSLDEPTDFDKEYSQYQELIAKYKMTESYKNPKNDNEKDFNQLVDFIQSADKESARAFYRKFSPKDVLSAAQQSYDIMTGKATQDYLESITLPNLHSYFESIHQSLISDQNPSLEKINSAMKNQSQNENRFSFTHVNTSKWSPRLQSVYKNFKETAYNDFVDQLELAISEFALQSQMPQTGEEAIDVGKKIAASEITKYFDSYLATESQTPGPIDEPGLDNSQAEPG